MSTSDAIQLLSTYPCSSTATFVYLSMNEKKLSQVFIGLAILFQPLIKISLGRTGWNIVDVIVAAFLIVSVFSKRID